jgi:hypothetical protein
VPLKVLTLKAIFRGKQDSLDFLTRLKGTVPGGDVDQGVAKQC